MNSQPNSHRIFTVYGNMGGDPEARTIAAKQISRMVYDPVTDGPIEKTWERPEIHFLTFSVATGGYQDIPLVWHYCVDWNGVAFRVRKGRPGRDRGLLRGSHLHRQEWRRTDRPAAHRREVPDSTEVENSPRRADGFPCGPAPKMGPARRRPGALPRDRGARHRIIVVSMARERMGMCPTLPAGRPPAGPPGQGELHSLKKGERTWKQGRSLWVRRSGSSLGRCLASAICIT